MKKHPRHRGVSPLGPVASGKSVSATLWAVRAAGFCCFFVFAALLDSAPEELSKPLELTRAARPWEFLCSVGQRAAIFGNESGNIEAWVYPLKLFRDFALTFHTEDRAWNADALVRSVIARPESTTLVYVGDTFRVDETFFVPVEEPGAVIKIQVDTEKPLEIEASFRRDFQLQWPAALGATYASWDEPLHAFMFGEELKKYAGVIGSPSGILSAEEFETNYARSTVSSLRLGTTARGKDTKLIVVAGSLNGAAEARSTYQKLSAHLGDLERASAEYYANYLRRTVQLELPDRDLERAYDWSRISMLQGLVANPYLGKGLVAGYRTSGASQRPGFAWFFGRDALWTSFALNSTGDFSTARDALRFLIQFQRDDGKIPHEIAQTASLVDWFKNYPYGFASADATPLFIIASQDYVRASGDAAFARENWNSLWKAYQFLRSTYDESGLPRNLGVGHGWVEGGPLLPVKSELYQSGLGAEALEALAELAKVADRNEEAKALAAEFEKQKPQLEAAFWSPEHKLYAFALDTNGKRVDEPSVLATVPMWFGLLDLSRSKTMIEQLAARDHATDWGLRIISDHSPLYSAGGYHFGSVWPLFGGWASVGEYRYHQAHPGLQALRANALLALDGSPGHVTEVLSGSYYQGLSTSSPHQIWSAAMVVSPILRGLLGLETDGLSRTITLGPTLPADWSSFAAHGLRAGDVTVEAAFHRTSDEMAFEIKRSGGGECFLVLQPALSLRAEVSSVELNGRPLPFHLEKNETDQHLQMRFAVYGGTSTLRIRLHNDFGVAYTATRPLLGQRSEGLRVLSETWSDARDRLTLEVQGTPGAPYSFAYFRGEELAGVEGAALSRFDRGSGVFTITMPPDPSAESVRGKITLQFERK